MEAAYGLSVTLTMLMTTVLISVYLHSKRVPMPLVILITGIFLVIELAFFGANLEKIHEGGWVSLIVGFVLCTIMWSWYKGRQLRRRLTVMEDTTEFFKTLKDLSNDQTLPQYATHLVYLTASDTPKKLEEESMRSILERTPKRADVYWFLHVETDSKPFTTKYKVETLAKEDVYFITFTFGFRIETRINYFFRMALEQLEKSGDVTTLSRHPALERHNVPGDIRFVILSSFLSHENDLNFKENFVMRSYYFLRRWFSLNEDEAYGLDSSNVVIEKIPIVVCRPEDLNLVREK